MKRQQRSSGFLVGKGLCRPCSHSMHMFPLRGTTLQQVQAMARPSGNRLHHLCVLTDDSLFRRCQTELVDRFVPQQTVLNDCERSVKRRQANSGRL